MCGGALSSAAVIVTAGIGATAGVAAAAGIGAAAGVAAAAGIGAAAGITVVIAIAFFTAACGTVCVTKTAAGAGLCGRGEQIQGEGNTVKVAAGIYISICGSAAGFGNTVAERVYQHVYGAEQFDNGEQTQCDIDGNGCAHGSIAIVTAKAVAAAVITATVVAATAIAATMVAVAVIVAAATASRIFQFGCQPNGFAFCGNEGSAMRIAAAVEQVGHTGDIGFCGTEQCYFQGVRTGGIGAADGAAVRTSEFQCVVKHIPKFQIPAAFTEGVGTFAQNVNSAQFGIVHSNSCSIDGRNDDISIAHHVVASIHAAASTSGRT